MKEKGSRLEKESVKVLCLAHSRASRTKQSKKKTVAAVGISARGGWDNATVGEKRVFWMSGRVKVAGSEAGDAINISALGSLKHWEIIVMSE